jgi:hypothetical protein
MRRYRVLLPVQVQPREGGSYSQHEEFDTAFTEDEETANVSSGLLAIVPQRYKVVGGSDVWETPTGEEFERALSLGDRGPPRGGRSYRTGEEARPKERKVDRGYLCAHRRLRVRSTASPCRTTPIR